MMIDIEDFRNRRPQKPRPDAKLTEEQVRTIRAFYRDHGREHGLVTWLARKYGVTPNTMDGIVRGATYRWVK